MTFPSPSASQYFQLVRERSVTESDLDITFDVRTDANGGDPDKTSPTLRRYHKLLWSKSLPNGEWFDLDSSSRRGYLYHKSKLGEFILTSDGMLPSFSTHKRYAHIIKQFPEDEIQGFVDKIYTIGGFIIFPGKRVGNQMTLNGARGCNHKIRDRFDLTLECIRRHYNGEESPLSNDIARYGSFFRLFDNFQGYVDFFLLQDLVVGDYSEILFFTPFDDFRSTPVPETIESYASFRDKTIAFVESRNKRITDLYR